MQRLELCFGNFAAVLLGRGLLGEPAHVGGLILQLAELELHLVGVLRLVLSRGLQRLKITVAARQLAAQLREKLKTVPGIRVLDRGNPLAALVTVTVGHRPYFVRGRHRRPVPRERHIIGEQAAFRVVRRTRRPCVRP